MYILKNKNSLTIGIFVLGLILIGYSIMNLSNEKVLVITNLDNQTTKEFYLPDDTFVLGYTHSVELTPAEEYFTVLDDNTLLLQRTVYESFGVGLPFEQENDWNFEIIDGKFILYIDREFQSIPMVISPIPNHWIGIGDMKFELFNLVNKDDAKISIHSENRTVLKFGKLYTIIF
ncbi:MAG: DUF1850 domain-containing protein [Clostridiales bacterium]|nr:DUF1850 domain-containing protein [Clostridiales bacterium]